MTTEPTPSLNDKEFLFALVKHFRPEAKVSKDSTEQEFVREILRSKEAKDYFIENSIPLYPRALEISKPGEIARRVKKQRDDMVSWGFSPSSSDKPEDSAPNNKQVLVAIIQHFDPNNKITKEAAHQNLVREILNITEAVQWVLDNHVPPNIIRLNATEVEQLVANVKEFAPDKSGKNIAVRMRKPQAGGPSM